MTDYTATLQAVLNGANDIYFPPGVYVTGPLAIGMPPQPTLPTGARPRRKVMRVVERGGPEVEVFEFLCARCIDWTQADGDAPRCEKCGLGITKEGEAR